MLMFTSVFVCLFCFVCFFLHQKAQNKSFEILHVLIRLLTLYKLAEEKDLKGRLCVIMQVQQTSASTSVGQGYSV